MNKRRTQKKKPAHPQTNPPAPDFRLFPSLLNGIQLLLIGTLISARYLLPAESAPQGDTLHVALGWFVLAVLFSCSLLFDRSHKLRIDRYDIGVWLLVSGQVIATLVMIFITDGQKRAALNMMWEWVSLGLCFSLVRRLITTPHLRMLLLQGLLTTIVLLAIYGIWQHHWMYDELSKEYLQIRQQLDVSDSPVNRSELQNKLISMGVPSNALSGSARQQFEDRLLNSTEPLGMFALANTFAGLLAVGFLIAFSQSIQILFYKSPHTLSKWDRFKSWIMLLPTVIIGYCLVLTKSRTAWIGVLGGLVCFGLLKLLQNQQGTNEQSPLRTKQVIKWGIIGGTILVGLFLLATFSGGFDRAVLTEAPKSLQYRFEYWTATWDVIKESPLWGTGPGNFREHYLRFKLPGSSEEIADPHNLFLDVWANGGIIALAGLLTVLILACYRWIIKPSGLLNETEINAASVNHENPYAQIALIAGFTLSFPLLWVFQLFLLSVDESILWIFCFSWLALYYLLEMGWHAFDNSDQTLPPSSSMPLALASAFFALSIHLLGAGGIAMPAITQTWLLLLAIAVPVASQHIDSGSSSTKESASNQPKNIHLSTIVLTVSVLLMIFFVMSSFAPTIQRKILVLKGKRALLRNPYVQSAKQYFRKASQADSFSPAPWQSLAELQWNQWAQQQQNRDEFNKGVELKKEAIRRTPLNPLNYFELGQKYFQQYLISKIPEDLDFSIQYLSQAVAGYPNNARYRAVLAEVLYNAGQILESQTEAQKAIELDDANRRAQHVDKYLTDDQLVLMNKIINLRLRNQN